MRFASDLARRVRGMTAGMPEVWSQPLGQFLREFCHSERVRGAVDGTFFEAATLGTA